jgi:hypothetical protein
MYMTLERYIGYSGFLLMFFHIVPFTRSTVNTVTIILSFGLILAGLYLHWKKRIQSYISSHNGHITIPRFFEHLGQHDNSPLTRVDRSESVE